jgi:hypothetical protein
MVHFPEIWVVSFGAKWAPGQGWQPAFLAATELSSQRNAAFDRTTLFAAPTPPYPTNERALLVCAIGEAIAGCHLILGWPLPRCIIDLQVEFRNKANGQLKPCGDGLAGALVWFGVSTAGAMGGSQTELDGHREVLALEQLFVALRNDLDLPRAVLRGRYLIAVGRIEANGIPIDDTKTNALKRHWRNVVREFGAASVSDAKPDALAIGADRRHRAELRPFSSRTGRNQPSSTQFIFAAPSWLRRLIKPAPGRGLAVIDWAQQEFGIAAALSGDRRMMADYRTGDAYLAFADRYGADLAPVGRRQAFKACALGVLNGIGPSGLARQIGSGMPEARLLLQQHRIEYQQFWRWSDEVEMHACLDGQLQSVFGWGMTVTADTNPRFLRNFPMQANGAEMLRLACCLATEDGVMVCAPNHDALLIEAPLEELAEAIDSTEAAMAEASAIVLDGFALRASATTIRYPDHYPHPRSDALWCEINRGLAELEGSREPAHERDASCARMHPRPISSYVLNRKDRSDAHH